MKEWKPVLKGETIGWLLEDNNPSVKYFTLTDILDRSQSDAEVEKAKREIMQFGVVPEILSKQNKDGFWEDSKRFYTAKYKGTVWQLIILAELGADGKNEKIKKAVEFIIGNSQDPQSGGFSTYESVKGGGVLHSYVIPCLTGNLVFSLICLGYLEDPRVQKGIDYILRYQRFDDGIGSIPQGWPYDNLTMCFGKHSCHMGVVKSLKALAEIPPERRTVKVKEVIKVGVEYLLAHRIFRKSHNLDSVSKPGWLKLGFPLMYQDDILEILGILTKLGYKDERMNDALEVLISKQDKKGRWKLESTFNGKFQVDIEEKGKPSKWITLNALRVLKKFYS